MPNRSRAPRRALRRTTPHDRYARPVPQPAAPVRRRRRVSPLVWVGAAIAGLLLVGAAVLLLRRSGDDPRTDAASTAVAASPTRSPALDQRLARRDGATDTAEYTQVLDSLQAKLHQSGEQLARCAEDGVAELSRRNVQVSALDMLKRMDSVTTPQPADQRPEVRLSCRDVVRVITGASGQ